MDAVLAGRDSERITPKHAALYALVRKAARRSVEIECADLDVARAAGWSDEAIYDAITVCALFRFYNTWVDAAGVSPLDDYRPSGQRLATQGYAPEPPPEVTP